MLNTKLTWKTLLIVYSFFFITTSLQAQKSDYQKVCIITNDNDTIYGEASLNTDRVNALECNYRDTITGATRTYRPGEIAAYRFLPNGKLYVSKSIKINDAPPVVFLECLVEGGLTLYYYRNALNTFYFLENQKNEMVEMDNKEVELWADNTDKKRYGGVNQKYKGVTAYMMNDWDEANDRVKRLRLNHKSMMKIVSDYNEAVCTSDSCIIYTSNDPTPLQIRFAVLGGITSLVLHNWEGMSRRENVAQFGAQAEFCSPRFSKALSLVAEISYLTWSGTDNYYNEKIDLTGKALEIRVLGRYTLGQNAIRPYGELGIVTSFNLNDTEDFDTADLSTPFSAVLGAGLRVNLTKKIGIFAGGFWNVRYRDMWGIRGGITF